MAIATQGCIWYIAAFEQDLGPRGVCKRTWATAQLPEQRRRQNHCRRRRVPIACLPPLQTAFRARSRLAHAVSACRPPLFDGACDHAFRLARRAPHPCVVNLTRRKPWHGTHPGNALLLAAMRVCFRADAAPGCKYKPPGSGMQVRLQICPRSPPDPPLLRLALVAPRLPVFPVSPPLAVLYPPAVPLVVTGIPLPVSVPLAVPVPLSLPIILIAAPVVIL